MNDMNIILIINQCNITKLWTRDVPDITFAGFRIPDVAGCCLPDSGYRIPTTAV